MWYFVAHAGNYGSTVMNAAVTSDIFIVVVFEEYLPIVMKEGSFDV